MKRDLFKTLSIATLCGFMLAFASCANEDITQKKTDTDNNNDKNLTTFVTGTEPESRTSMDYNSGAFFWEAGDYIYVKDDDGIWQKSKNAPTAKTAYFKFKVEGKFSTKSSYKVYYPGKNGINNQVTIPTTQTQTKPNTTTHFGVSGDCGTADATKVTGKNQFEFKLDHQAAYLVFQPYTSNTVLKNCYITKIEVNSDNDIASPYTYTLDPATGELTGTGTGQQIVLTTKGSGEYANGFPLTNTSPSVATNGAFMVIKPGTHTLKIRYWVKDIATNVEGTITKALSSHAFDKNKYYNMTANLNARIYDGNHYYMWDAKQQYWYGYEWTHHNLSWQPTTNGSVSDHIAKNNADSRWYHEGMGPAPTQSCTVVPNINEISWYTVKGDPRWDGEELWVTMGHLYKGGVWVKKKSYIPGFSALQDVNGYDARVWASGYGKTCSADLPSASEAYQFFYLPTLGRYSPSWGPYPSALLTNVGTEGDYWVGHVNSNDSNGAFVLFVDEYRLYVSSMDRDRGAIAQPFSDFGDE